MRLKDKVRFTMGGRVAVYEPCPFCGAPLPDGVTTHDTFEGDGYAVKCGNPDCAAFGPLASTRDDAIRAWNRRKTQ